MKKHFKQFGLSMMAAVGVCVGLASCDNNLNTPDMPAPEITLTRSQTIINDNFNDFGLDFFSATASDAEFVAKNPNFAVSPISLAMVMSMCANSLDDDFKERICERFGADDLYYLNSMCHVLRNYLPDPGNKCDMIFANSVWYRDGYMSPSDDYESRIGDFYDGVVNPIDFDSDTAADEINAWASRHTSGLIKEVTANEELEQTLIFLANAMYFKSTWSSPFKTESTVEGTFHGSAGDATVKYMNKVIDTKYKKVDGYEIATLPYAGPYEFVMILPEEGSNVASAASTLTNESLSDVLTNSWYYSVTLSLPKFESEAKIECENVFDALGLSLDIKNFKGFNPDYDIDNPDLLLKVNHFTNIKIDEEGTVAAAVSTANAMDISLPNMHAALKLDRPFIYLVRNTKTGSIVIAGQFTQP